MRRNPENAVTWRHQQLSTTLNAWTERFAERFLAPVLEPGQDGGLPSPIVGFESFDYRIYAYYRLGKNAFGLEDEIILNEKHVERPLYAVLETVLHEQIHLWQQRRGAHPVQRNYHNQEFVSKAEQLGLHPQLDSGVHTRPADEQYERLLREYGIAKPPEEQVYPVAPNGEKRNWWEDPGRERRGRSTLEKWCCGCGQNARIGAMAYFAVCVRCRQPFLPEREVARWLFAEELTRLLGKEQDARRRSLYKVYLARLTGAERMPSDERAAQAEVSAQAYAACGMAGPEHHADLEADSRLHVSQGGQSILAVPRVMSVTP